MPPRKELNQWKRYKILYYICYETLHDKSLNYLYVDTFAKEHVLQQKNRA